MQRPVLAGSGKSFGLFAEDARIRVWAFRLVGHRGFEALVIVAILVREMGTQVDDHHVFNSLFALISPCWRLRSNCPPGTAGGVCCGRISISNSRSRVLLVAACSTCGFDSCALWFVLAPCPCCCRSTAPCLRWTTTGSRPGPACGPCWTLLTCPSPPSLPRRWC